MDIYQIGVKITSTNKEALEDFMKLLSILTNDLTIDTSDIYKIRTI